MVDAWPASLPQEMTIQGYQEPLGKNSNIRTQMDVGEAKVRGRSTAIIKPIVGTVVMTSDQVDTLITFYFTTLGDGSGDGGGGVKRFTWIHPRTGAAETFRFVEEPVVGPMHPRYIISMVLEILP